MRRDVFQAIADPKRRAIIHMLSEKKSTLGEVAANFEISLPAISKHMKILAECGLVVIELKGRERHCEARLEKLSEVAQWVDHYRKFFGESYDRLDDYLKQLQAKKSNQKRK